MRNLSLWKD
uniref:Uncharacterized protein n=1 Tax=Rhizophora mucronata TaxID=61149 RepID=A0A2P2NYJ4_RHIMU